MSVAAPAETSDNTGRTFPMRRSYMLSAVLPPICAGLAALILFYILPIAVMAVCARLGWYAA
ncbi:hypothetical protein ACN93_03775 [Gordonia paraffinivorans]|nr:hypothetical protein ACN93_03775 [Gordonia paraffinivorans]